MGRHPAPGDGGLETGDAGADDGFHPIAKGGVALVKKSKVFSGEMTGIKTIAGDIPATIRGRGIVIHERLLMLEKMGNGIFFKHPFLFEVP